MAPALSGSSRSIARCTVSATSRVRACRASRCSRVRHSTREKTATRQAPKIPTTRLAGPQSGTVKRSM